MQPRQMFDYLLFSGKKIYIIAKEFLDDELYCLKFGNVEISFTRDEFKELCQAVKTACEEIDSKEALR